MANNFWDNKYFAKVQESANFLKNWQAAPEIIIVLGSGLGNSVPDLDKMPVLKYADIPGFNSPKVSGHQGELRVGAVTVPLADGVTKTRTFAFLCGRNHAYEGYNAAEVVHNLRSLLAWGCKGVILTTASACLKHDWELGKMMLFADHINATNLSPLFGEFGEAFGQRFVDMSAAYDKEWQQMFLKTAQAEQRTLYQGTFYGVQGPQYETPAEVKMLQLLGASAVSMSTVLEVLAARQLGAKVAALSCFTNYGAGMKNTTLTHAEVTAMGKKFTEDIYHVLLKTAVELPS